MSGIPSTWSCAKAERVRGDCCGWEAPAWPCLAHRGAPLRGPPSRRSHQCILLSNSRLRLRGEPDSWPPQGASVASLPTDEAPDSVMGPLTGRRYLLRPPQPPACAFHRALHVPHNALPLASALAQVLARMLSWLDQKSKL